MGRQRVSLAPLLGANSRRVSDRALQGTYMRGGFNVELRDGEWWTRQGEQDFGPARIGSCPWWWVVRVNKDLVVIANPWWALALTSDGKLKELYTAAATENVAVTNGSANVTTSTTRTVDQMVLVGVGSTTEVYRIVSRVGTAAVLDRPYEGSTNAAKSCRFIDPLARNTAGTAVAYTAAFAINGSWWQAGSCVVFEQLVSHTATDLYAASPTLTGGNLHLVITSNVGVPVAIDLSAYIAGSTVGVRRTWFYNTSLGSSAAVIGSDTLADDIYPRGLFAEVYKGRLFIAAASDPNGKYGSRTVWWSQIGDIGRWHTGIAGQTSAPNFKTFDGEGNRIAEMKALQDALVIHRQDTQEVATATQSLAQPFVFQSNNQGLGVRQNYQANCVVVANGVHYMWTRKGPAVFDGSRVSLICDDARDALRSLYFAGGHPAGVSTIVHDQLRGRIYWYGGLAPSTVTRAAGALPATAQVTLLSGESIYNYCSVFVYDYLNNAYWFEDRPSACGGGAINTDLAPENGTPVVSRPDGTIVKLFGYATNGKDPDHLAPTTSGSDVAVYAQVETPWIDFGNLSRKHLTEVELVVRSPDVGEGILEDSIALSGTPWIRMRVYTDRDISTTRADVGDSYALSDAKITSAVGPQQAAESVLTLTPNSHGRQFKLVFSNALTSSAITAGYAQLPFRISDIECEFSQKESTIPRTTLTSASISE